MRNSHKVHFQHILAFLVVKQILNCSICNKNCRKIDVLTKILVCLYSSAPRHFKFKMQRLTKCLSPMLNQFITPLNFNLKGNVHHQLVELEVS
jgi:hypothetical protein